MIQHLSLQEEAFQEAEQDRAKVNNMMRKIQMEDEKDMQKRRQRIIVAVPSETDWAPPRFVLAQNMRERCPRLTQPLSKAFHV